jgi:hypothetical protein
MYYIVCCPERDSCPCGCGMASTHPGYGGRDYYANKVRMFQAYQMNETLNNHGPCLGLTRIDWYNILYKGEGL